VMTSAAITGTYVLYEHVFVVKLRGNYPLTGGKNHERIPPCPR
jgi:hypothetical protein